MGHRLRRLSALLVGLSLIVAALSWIHLCHAHDLSIDRASLWPAPDLHQVRGQVTLDPELTRPIDAPVPHDLAERELIEFLRKNFTVYLNDQPCRAHFELRELYVRGGAVPGDLVMFECAAPAKLTHLAVRVGDDIKALVVTVSGFAEGRGPESILLGRGETSPRYTLAGANPTQWAQGGPEQFEPRKTRAAPPPATVNATPKLPPEAPSLPPTASARPSATGFERPNMLAAFWSYVMIGFSHILPLGWDHVLFVAGLTLGARGQWRRLLLELSTFTLAHTVTLGLGAAGWVVVPGTIVEPLIALSIIYVAAMNLRLEARSHQRLAVAFGFGLVHGQGFAGVLRQFDLSGSNFLTALLGFNVGVELGQAAAAGALLVLLTAVPSASRRSWVVTPVSLATITVGVYWLLQRVFG